MMLLIRHIIIAFLLCSYAQMIAQCGTDYPKNQSPKIANYTITVELDHIGKFAHCKQILSWKNTSPDTIRELRFYMYMNSFKDLKSSYLRNSRGNVFGRNLNDWKPEEWGHISMDKIVSSSEKDLTSNAQYIQLDDTNENDQSVLEVTLHDPIFPGESDTFEIDFTTKMPKTIARSGYSKDDFFLFVHWFPQVGVYEANKDGVWGWNCHQFVPGTEFFADFGDYDVTITASDHLTIGGSGCRVSHTSANGIQKVNFVAHDLIDFGFVVYSDFDTYTSNFHGVDIEILMPPEHCAFAERYLSAVEHGIEYLGKNVGPYPYPKITIVDPPMHALNSGFMEYPMMITAASFYGIPSSIKSVESLVIHEFTHMYFMATLASNEKEEAWLDEGFVTYYEDRITDYYGGPKSSLFNVFGFRSGNAENSRLEYSKLDHTRLGPIAKPGWEIKGPYKGLIYAKTSTMLKTLEGLVSSPVMDEIIQAYFQAYKFKHPKEADFRRIVREVLATKEIDLDQDLFFDQCLHGTEICDYQLTEIKNERTNEGFLASFTASQLGGLIFPVDIAIEFENGDKEVVPWDGKNKMKTFEFTSKSKLISAHIDPEQKIFLDINFNNNSITQKANYRPALKYEAKASNWMQTFIHYASFLF